MGSGISTLHKVPISEASLCLDEDVFGKISNTLPNTAVPIEIKPKKKLNGGRKRISLRGDSVNKSSSFFSNLSSNKNANGSLVSFLSLNKSEYKRQNEQLKNELKEVKQKLTIEIQSLMTSNVTLNDQNQKLKGEIKYMKNAKKKIHKELILALDNQLAMKENVQLYEHKVNELQNVITVKSKNNFGYPSFSHNDKFLDKVNNQITSTIIEFMITSVGSGHYKLNDISKIHIKRRTILLYLCNNVDKEVIQTAINEMMVLLGLVISNFVFVNITHIITNKDNLKSDSINCDMVVVFEEACCMCSTNIELITGRPTHLIRYSKVKKPCPPIEEINSLLTKYNVFHNTLRVDIKTVVLHLLQCDSYSMSPLVYDYASFFSLVSEVVIRQDLDIMLSDKTHLKRLSDVSNELDFYLDHFKNPLYISCSLEECELYQASLKHKLCAHLTVFYEINSTSSFGEISKGIFSSLFYQIGLDQKYVSVNEHSLFSTIDYLSLFFNIFIIFNIKAQNITKSLESFIFLQQKSKSHCLIIGPAKFVNIIQLCDSVLLSDSHTPALSALHQKFSSLNEITDYQRSIVSYIIQLLNIFKSGLSDSCLSDILKCDILDYFNTRHSLLAANYVSYRFGLIRLNPMLINGQDIICKNLIVDVLRHWETCRCYHLHLNDMANFLSISKSLAIGHAIVKNPEALAYYTYNQRGSSFMESVKPLMSNDHLCNVLNTTFENKSYSDAERILIYRIISQLFFRAEAFHEAFVFMKKAEDLEIYTKCEPCLTISIFKCKMYLENCRLNSAETLLQDIYNTSVKMDLSTDTIQVLLIRSGIEQAFEKSRQSRFYLDKAHLLYQNHLEIVEVKQILVFCSLLQMIGKHDTIDKIFQGLLSKITYSTSYHLISMVLYSYASFNASISQLPCAISLLEYLKNSDNILVDEYRKNTLRLLGMLYAKVKRYNEASEIYKLILGTAISQKKMDDKEVLEDIYNYVFVLIKIRYFGTAYDILKSVCDRIPESHINSHFKSQIYQLMAYLRAIISRFKPNSGHYRVAKFV